MQQTTLPFQTRGRGLMEITTEVQAAFSAWPEMGLLHLFLQHTSAGLVLQENADPSARRDLEEFFDRLAPEDQSWHEHTLEGPDDSPAHMRSALIRTSLQIPIQDGRLALGTWQGIYLFEHRRRPHRRQLVLTLVGAEF